MVSIKYFFSLLLFSIFSFPVFPMEQLNKPNEEEQGEKKNRDIEEDLIEESELKKIKLDVDYSDFECQKHKEEHAHFSLVFELLDLETALKQKCPWCFFKHMYNKIAKNNTASPLINDKRLFLPPAIACGKTVDFQKILESLGDLDDKLINKMIPGACDVGALEITKILVTKGCNIEYCEDEGLKQTPLMRCIQSQIKNSEIVHYLIKQGANIFAQDNEGRNVFWWACAELNFCSKKKNKNAEEIKMLPESKIVLLLQSPQLLLSHPLNIGRCLDDTTRPLLETFLMCMKKNKCFPKGVQMLIVFWFGQENCLETLKSKMNIGPKSLPVIVDNKECLYTLAPDWRSIK